MVFKVDERVTPLPNEAVELPGHRVQSYVYPIWICLCVKYQYFYVTKAKLLHICGWAYFS